MRRLGQAIDPHLIDLFLAVPVAYVVGFDVVAVGTFSGSPRCFSSPWAVWGYVFVVPAVWSLDFGVIDAGMRRCECQKSSIFFTIPSPLGVTRLGGKLLPLGVSFALCTTPNARLTQT